ncbi:MAG: serine hydrolase, partial [Pirellulaceae bacterium]
MKRLLFIAACCCLVACHVSSRAFGQTDTATIDEHSLQALQEVVEGYAKKNYFVGAELLVIQGDQTLYHHSFGDLDRDNDRLWENNTICNIRSMTKPMTGVAAQILVDRGLLDIDKPVATYLESFDNDESRSITVRQVLTHRSGLPLTNLLKVDQYPTLADQVAKAGETGPQFEPDSKFWYSDIGTDVVGRLVEKISGELLHEFVGREIIEPLGMTETFYGFDAEDERFSRIAPLYFGGANGWLRFWSTDKGEAFYPCAWGSQTVYSTTTDYAKFMQMFADGGKVDGRQIISPEAIDRILKPVSPMKMLGSDADYPAQFRDLKAYYGQMMITYRPEGEEQGTPQVIGHSGSDGTAAWLWPDRDLIILFFTQSRGGTTVIKMEGAIDQLIIHPEEAMAASEVPDEFRPYVGMYVANFATFENEEFEVRVRDGQLILDIPSQLPFELLEPDDEGKWAFKIAPEQVKVTFDRDDAGNVIGLHLHQAGQSFEVPAKGTARAEELSIKREVTESEMQQLVGTYYDEDSEGDVEVLIEDGELAVSAPPGIVFHLRPGKEKGHW